jgi:hypothetical protein
MHLLILEHFLYFSLNIGLGPLLLMLPFSMLLPLAHSRSCSYGLLPLKVQMS